MAGASRVETGRLEFYFDIQSAGLGCEESREPVARREKQVEECMTFPPSDHL